MGGGARIAHTRARARRRAHALTTAALTTAHTHAGAARRCDLTSISEPDNLHVIGNTLIINEDTAGHQNNVAWCVFW